MESKSRYFVMRKKAESMADFNNSTLRSATCTCIVLYSLLAKNKHSTSGGYLIASTYLSEAIGKLKSHKCTYNKTMTVSHNDNFFLSNGLFIQNQWMEVICWALLYSREKNVHFCSLKILLQTMKMSTTFLDFDNFPKPSSISFPGSKTA